ncbi:type II secretion system F family protein [Clostridium sp. SHJSY1]|uniref:type II secretion system F family protein n=1 Tax=Clostridium sp. SHJSY1 TaxID=2942483 RepID=UPI0028748B52|nr:type II secretion system F family protein [Clostridium sp. SHJSY1]MDS0525882.1 type II secretion system F family protein [Clostridium sp. SHJSY1]
MLYIVSFIFFIVIFSFVYGGLIIISKDKMKIEKRLSYLKEIHVENEEAIENKSFSERLIKPLYQSFSEGLIKITPQKKLQMLNKRLERAGVLKNSNMEKWLFNKIIIILAFSSMIGLLSFMVEPNVIKAITLVLIIIIAINTFFSFYLSRKIENRKKKILKELPYTLDLITVSVEAGLSFDGAMARVIGNISGELCDEFAKSLKEIKMGIERKVALKNMSERCDVKELSMFVTSLIQADELGVSLSRILRIESANLREHRKQVSREKAMKAPIKMLFPLVFFIFPSIFIIILGPAVIRMIKIFGEG